jgi:membrane protease YdiL (CAAX protease family)
MVENDKAFGNISVEWDNSGFLVSLEVAIGVIALLWLGVLNAIAVNTGDFGLSATIGLLQGLIVYSGIIFVGEKAWEILKGKEKKDIFESVGYGKSNSNFFIAVFFGVLFAIVLNFSSLSIVVPGIQSVNGGISTLVFVVFFAATVEELFFRGSLLPTANKVLKTMGFSRHAELALGIQAIAFGVFHYGVLLAVNPSASLLDARIVSSTLFGLIMGVGNGFFESTGFGYAAHLVNNFIAVGGFSL